MGDDTRGDGDPHLTLFGKKVTPNMHALARRFPLLDHVYADSEASIDGHYWTAAGAVSDYVIRNWHQNYAGRGRPYDFGSYEVSAPPTGYIFERMLNAGISFFNYGEALAGLSPFPDKDKTAAEQATAAAGARQLRRRACWSARRRRCRRLLRLGPLQQHRAVAGADPGLRLVASRRARRPAPTPASIASRRGSSSRTRPRAFRPSTTSSCPTTTPRGRTPGRRTPTAQIASNDWALGQIVELISHSDIWKHSLILVQEDDSQDGADHVDAHRIPALAISPYTRKGAVIHTRYDQLSMLRTAELVMGLKPMNLAEALAVPLYDAFSPKPTNSAAYSAIVPERGHDRAEHGQVARGEVLGRPEPARTLDQVSSRTLDRILWKYVHGPHAKAPPPGPNASTSDTDPGEDVPLPHVRQGYRAQSERRCAPRIGDTPAIADGAPA